MRKPEYEPYGYFVKNVKTFIGNEGDGYNCDIFRKVPGFKVKKVAFAYDDASGGEVTINFVSVDEESRWNEYVRSLPKKNFEGVDLTVSDGMFIGSLLQTYDDDKAIRRFNKRNETAFRMKGDKENILRVIKKAPAPDTFQYIHKKWGDKVEYIFNDLPPYSDVMVG